MAQQNDAIDCNSNIAANNRARFKEILSILRRNKILKGITPQKLRTVIEQLGTTFIKLGQMLSMRNDVMPKEYCDELSKLQTDVPSMPFEDVKSVIESSYDKSLDSIFMSFNKQPLGSASIAQAHLAKLFDGVDVVVKVQRKGIYKIMSRDIDLIRKILKYLKHFVKIGDVIDFNMVLNELWTSAQEEMDFLIEADNAEEFFIAQKDVAFVSSPKIYRALTTKEVLVMEYIEGISVENKSELLKNGYDLSEIGAKLADNYVKQVTEDGFFHADPHPGNLRIRNGQIVWIDFGMMGRISHCNQTLITEAVKAVAKNDASKLKDIILAMGECHAKINHAKLYGNIEELLVHYGTMELGEMNMAEAMEDAIKIAKDNQISIPAGFSMLVRGLATIERVVADISPDINMVAITAAHFSNQTFDRKEIEKELKASLQSIFDSGRKALDVPSLYADMLRMTNKGQLKTNIEITPSDDCENSSFRLVNKLVGGLLAASLMIGSSILCTTKIQPELFGVPLIGILGFVASIVIGIILFVHKDGGNK